MSCNQDHSSEHWIVGFIIGGFIMSTFIFGVQRCSAHVDRDGHMVECVKGKWINPDKCVEYFGDK